MAESWGNIRVLTSPYEPAYKTTLPRICLSNLRPRLLDETGPTCPPASRAASTSKLPLTVAFGSGKTLMLKRFPGEVPCKGCPRATHLPCIDRCFISGRRHFMPGTAPASSIHPLCNEHNSEMPILSFV